MDCPYCLEAIEDQIKVKLTSCGHLLHKNCIENWMKTGKASCPQCSQPLVVLPINSKGHP